MNRQRVGLGLFWFGAVYMFAASWLAMWWVAPIFANTPPEEFDALPYHYSFGTKAVYLALAWLFTFLSQYESAQVAK